MNMTKILNDFAGGISFAVGALIGVSVIAFFMRAHKSRQMNTLIAINSRIENRLEKQVYELSRIANALENKSK